MTTVIEHELIIRGRYPDYVERVDEFLRRPELGALGHESLAHSLPHLIAGTDYRLVLGDPNRPTTTEGRTITLSSTGASSQASISVFGMQTIIDIGDGFHPDAFGRGLWSAPLRGGRRGRRGGGLVRELGAA